MSSDRSKRRKVRNELNHIKCLYSNSTNEPHESIVVIENCEKESNKSNDSHSPITADLNPNPQIVDSFFDKTEVLAQEKLSIIEEQNVPLISANFENKLNSCFEKDLAVWAVDCNVPQSTVNSLLHLMKMYDSINTKTLPRDCRTLLATPQSIGTKLRCVAPGMYYHFGLSTGILRFASSKLSEIQ
ncbi:Uncharacterized protein FWK35_00038731, partial [Aphis craccivora]